MDAFVKIFKRLWEVFSVAFVVLVAGMASAFGNSGIAGAQDDGEEVSVFGLNLGNVYEEDAIRRLSSRSELLCTVPQAGASGQPFIRCSVSGVPIPYSPFSNYTITLTEDYQLIGLSGQTTSPGDLSKGKILDNFNSCLATADLVIEALRETEGVELNKVDAEPLETGMQITKLLSDGTSLATWEMKERQVKDQDRFVSVNGQLTCSEEPFRPGGNAMLRFYVVMDV